MVVRLVGYPSGQRGQTVNLLAYAFDGSNPSPTTTFTLSHCERPRIDVLQNSQVVEHHHEIDSAGRAGERQLQVSRLPGIRRARKRGVDMPHTAD